MAKRAHRFLAFAVSALTVISATAASARNHVSNCLTDEGYRWHETHYSLDCVIKADEETGLMDFYSSPDPDHKYPQGRGPWVQVHVSEMVSFEDDQFLGGTGSDYNGNTTALKMKESSGELTVQRKFYVLATDADCTLKPAGYYSATEELKPSELCRIKNQ